MLSVFQKIIDTLSLSISFLNRVDSSSLKFKQKTKVGDNIAGNKYINYQTEPQKEFIEVVYAWSTHEIHQENHKIMAYEFDLTLLNKGEEIIKDLWVNFSSSGFNLEIERTNHTDLFEGWNIHNQAINLVLKSDYRYAPQNLLYPFKIRIIIKKELIPNDAWLYFSFGAPNVKKVEKKAKVTREQLKEFVTKDEHNIKAFLQLLGLAK